MSGSAAINVPKVPVADNVKAAAAFGTDAMDVYAFHKGETILVPADMPDFYLVPTSPDTILLEATDGLREEVDEYINPDAPAELPEE